MQQMNICNAIVNFKTFNISEMILWFEIYLTIYSFSFLLLYRWYLKNVHEFMKKNRWKSTSIYKDKSGCLYFSLHHTIHTSLICYKIYADFCEIFYILKTLPYISASLSLSIGISRANFQTFNYLVPSVRKFPARKDYATSTNHLHFLSGSEYKKLPIATASSQPSILIIHFLPLSLLF